MVKLPCCQSMKMNFTWNCKNPNYQPTQITTLLILQISMCKNLSNFRSLVNLHCFAMICLWQIAFIWSLTCCDLIMSAYLQSTCCKLPTPFSCTRKTAYPVCVYLNSNLSDSPLELQNHDQVEWPSWQRSWDFTHHSMQTGQYTKPIHKHKTNKIMNQPNHSMITLDTLE